MIAGKRAKSDLRIRFNEGPIVRRTYIRGRKGWGREVQDIQLECDWSLTGSTQPFCIGSTLQRTIRRVGLIIVDFWEKLLKPSKNGGAYFSIGNFKYRACTFILGLRSIATKLVSTDFKLFTGFYGSICLGYSIVSEEIGAFARIIQADWLILSN